MFILQHHLQHLTSGFRMSRKIQFLTLRASKTTALWKKFHKMKQNLSKFSVLFVTFSSFVWLFWYGFLLTQKFGALAPYKSKSLLSILQRTTKKFHFLLFPFQFFFSKIMNPPFRTKTLSLALWKNFQNLAEPRKLEPLYIVNYLTVTKNSHNKLRLIFDLQHVNFLFFLFIRIE